MGAIPADQKGNCGHLDVLIGTDPVIRFKHHVIDDFLPAADRAAMLAFAFANEARFAPALLRRGSASAYAPESRKSLQCQAPLGDLERRFAEAIIACQDELFAAIGTPRFDVDRHEIELVVHRDGCFFAAHKDTVTEEERVGLQSDRLISVVYYFHALPRGFSGGELAIYPFGGDEPDLIEPFDNRLVAFPSIAAHEVRPISVPGDRFADARFSINCWLHRARVQ